MVSGLENCCDLGFWVFFKVKTLKVQIFGVLQLYDLNYGAIQIILLTYLLLCGSYLISYFIRKQFASFVIICRKQWVTSLFDLAFC